MRHSKLQKLFSVMLAALLAALCFVPAFATPAPTPVIVVSGMGSRPMTLENGKSVFPPSTDIILKGLFKSLGPILGTMVFQNGMLFDRYGASGVHDLFDALAVDENGKSVQNVISELFPDSMDHYIDTFSSATVNENGVVRAIAETVGWENTYFFNYDWRMNPLDIAEDLHDMVEYVKEKHGVSQISVIALSMGGNVASSYLFRYGSADFKTLVLASTAFLGVEMVGRLFAGDLSITTQAVLHYFVPFLQSLNQDALASLFGKLAQSADKSGTPFLNRYLAKLTETLKNPLYQKVFMDTFARFLGAWSFVPAEFYADAKANISNYTTVSDYFLEQIDALQDVQKRAPSLIEKARRSGTNVYIIGAYGFGGIPVTSGASNHTDNLIDTYLMTGNCAVAPFGKTLEGMDYDRTAACGNKSHCHISTDNVIDAGVGLLPDQTWIIKGMSHVEFGYDHDTSKLAVWLVSSGKPLNVYSDPRYPQFTELDRKTGKLVSLTQNVTVPGQDETAPQTLLQKIAAFFETLFARIRAFFGQQA